MITNIIAPDGYDAHWNPDMSDSEYYADKTAINSSSLKRMLKSPRAFYVSYFLNKNPEPTKSMKFGTLAHLALLQGSKFKDNYVVMPEFVGLTKDGRPTNNPNSIEVKKQKEEWISSLPPGSIITTNEDRDKIFSMIESLLSHNQAMKLLSEGQPEIAGFWRDNETGLRLKIKPDFVSFRVNALVDIKTTTDCIWDEFRRSVESLRYDFQAMMYADGIKQITGIKPDHKVWIAIESKPPYEVAVYEIPEEYEITGVYDYRHALKMVKNYYDLNTWPQRQTDIEYGEMSSWFRKKYELLGVFND